MVRAKPPGGLWQEGTAATEIRQLVQDVVQALALDELHCEVVHALVLADAEDRHDVGMVQTCRRPRLTPEAFEVGRRHQP
jgi:hypothetical protein